MCKSRKEWFVYMVCCADKTIYTGITTDLTRRIEQHNSAKGGARYTRSRRPVSLVYSEKAADRSNACKRERALKNLTSREKRELIVQASQK